MLRHRRASPRLAAAALAAALLAAGCRRGAGPVPERYLPARCTAVVVVPELRRAAKELAALQETAAAFPGGAQLPELRRSIAAQLGFDVLDPEGASKAGLEPGRGLAIGVEALPGQDKDARPAPVVVLPVRDAGALRTLVARVARERLGAGRERPLEGGGSGYTYGPDAGAPALALAFAEGDKVAVLSAGGGAADAVRAALARKPAESLEEAPDWRDVRKALGDRYALLLAFLPPAQGGSPLPPGRAVAAGLSAQPGSVRLGVRVRIDPATAAALPGRGAARALVAALSREAPLVARWDGDPAALGRLLVPRVAEPDRRWLADRGFDLQRDLFDLLAPGVAASLSLSPRLDLTDLSDVALRADPLRLVSFELAADVKDEAAAGRALARLPALLAALAQGAPKRSAASPPASDLEAPAGPVKPGIAEPSGRSGRVPTASGELAWRLDGKRLRMTGGPPGALEALLARKAGAGWTAPAKDAAGALEGGLGGAVLAPRRLAASVRALPDDAFGTGPLGFVVRGIADRYLEALETVQAASLRVEPAQAGEAALLLELRIEAPREEKP